MDPRTTLGWTAGSRSYVMSKRLKISLPRYHHRMTLSDLEFICEIFNDTKHRAASLRQLSFLWLLPMLRVAENATFLPAVTDQIHLQTFTVQFSLRRFERRGRSASTTSGLSWPWSHVERRKLDHFDSAANSQWRRRLSACDVSYRLTVDILSTFCDGFLVQCVKLMLSKFVFFFTV